MAQHITPAFLIQDVPKLLAGADPRTFLKTSGGVSLCTVGLEAAPIPGLKVTLRDTWCIPHLADTCQGRVLGAVLQGVLPSNWKMDDDLQDHAEALRIGDATRYKRKIHAVILVVHAATIVTDDSEETMMLKHSCSQVEVLPVR